LILIKRTGGDSGAGSRFVAGRRETIIGCGWDCMRWESVPAPTER
jgi:hypothetical protein